MYKFEVESTGLVTNGISTCQGCGLEVIERNVINTLGSDIILIVPPGCAAMLSGTGIEAAVKVPGFQCNLENTAAVAAGVAAGLKAQGNDHTRVVGFAGDGGTADIGLQALSGAMERNDDILYICYDNEAYMNTGVQGSSSTPLGAATTTTPAGKPVRNKDLMQIVMAHHVPYAASASIANLTDLKKKVAKARDLRGCRVLHIHCPCPTGWGYKMAKTYEVAREAVKSGAWLLYEYENNKVKISQKPTGLGDVDAYLGLQKRFAGLSDADKAAISDVIRERYSNLEKEAAQ